MPKRKKWLTGLLALLLFGTLFWLGYRYGVPVVTGELGKGNIPVPGQFTLMVLIALGTLVSEDLACIGAGLLSATGRMDYLAATVASFTGIFVGDMIIFWLGMHFGRPLVRHRWARWFISERSLNRAEHLFHQHGIWIILLTRFIPGTRTATYFSAGAVHAPPLRFVSMFAFAALLWTPVLVGVSHIVGARLLELYHVYEAFALPAIILTGLLLYLFIHYGIPLFTWRGRRQLRGKLIRAFRWEYWPVWQVNWLVVLYVLYLGIFRYHRLTLFTAVNPCMPHGGFLGESKVEIFHNLEGATDALPAWAHIPSGKIEERMQRVRDKMGEFKLSYPVVMKPDQGQRGSGVKIVRDGIEAKEWLNSYSAPAILQEYVGGLEFGVFYARRPSEPEGRIISLTIKQQLELTGNGKDSLETLIYRNPRAIVLLDLFLDRFDEKLEEIPENGEKIPLGELGTHALGALFLDGRTLVTPELTRRVDRIAKSCPGFYFGRFDFKTDSVDALQCGRGLKVIELNGVTSECTHIYDPRHGLMHAWRTLMAQWRLAFEIAEENRRAGERVSPAGEFLSDIMKAWRRQRNISGN